MMSVTTPQSQRLCGVVLLALIGAQAVHWFITPMRHPYTSALRQGLVAVQAFVAFGGTVWLMRSGGRVDAEQIRS